MESIVEAENIELIVENNRVLGDLFTIATQPLSLDEMLGQCVDTLLNLSWLSLLPKAGVFLADQNDFGESILRLAVNRNLDHEVMSLCNEVEFGECLCGQAALTKKPIHTSCINDLHTTSYEGMEPHGHYCIPIMSGEIVLGVLVFYLPDGTAQNVDQLEFLSRCTSVLSLAIELRKKERELEVKNRVLISQQDALKQAQNVAKMGSWSLDVVSNHLIWSDEIFKIFGIDPLKFEASLEAFYSTIHSDDLESVKHQYEASISEQSTYSIDHRIIRQDTGEVRWVHEMCVHQYDENEEVIQSDGTVQDITNRKIADEQIRHLAMTDHLTDLANRSHFHRRFNENIKLAYREEKRLALMIFDLDRFKPVNDTFGHLVGDALLQEVASILLKHSRETDVVARIGGDEFAVLVVHPESRRNIEMIALRIISEISLPKTIMGHELTVGISIGISLYPDDSNDDEKLFHMSDLALYEAKRQGRNCHCFYEPSLET